PRADHAEAGRNVGVSARIERLRARFPEAGIDALVVTGAANRRYLSGFTGSAGTLVITQDQALLLVDFRYVEQASRQAPAFRIVRYDDVFQALGEQLGAVGARRVGFEAEHVTVAQMEKLRQAAAVEWVATERLVEEVRGIKDAQELQLIEEAVALA